MDEQQPQAVLPPDAPTAVVDGANGREPEASDERDALDWFLGATVALEYDVPVKYETPGGMTTLTFHLKQLDGDRIEEVDVENRSGDGPFGRLDTLSFNAQLVAEATVYIQSESGRKVEPMASEFLGGIPSPVLAMKLRFKKQPYLLEHLADRIREKAGFSPDRVGSAQRSLVDAGKPSSS